MRRPILSLALLGLALGIAHALSGCSGGEREPVGRVDLALTGTSASGKLYRLRNAVIEIIGPTAATVTTDDDPDAPSVELELKAGAYVAELNDDWILERAVQGTGTFEPVEAVLASTNPLPFKIERELTTHVRLLFNAGETVELEHSGRAVVEIGVDDCTGAGDAGCADLDASPDGDTEADAEPETDASHDAASGGDAGSPPLCGSGSHGPGATSRTWGTEERIEDSPESTNARIAMDAAGNALAVWVRTTDILARRFDAPTLSWGSGSRVGAANQDRAAGLEVAMDAMGNAFALWQGIAVYEGQPLDRCSLASSRYDAATRVWGAQVDLGPTADLLYDPSQDTWRLIPLCHDGAQIAMSAGGDAVAVWADFFVGHGGLVVGGNRYDAAAGAWTNAWIGPGQPDTSRPVVAMNAAGNAFAVWVSSIGFSPFLEAARYDGSWHSSPPTLGPVDLQAIPRVAMDDAGNALAVWLQTDIGLVANRYDAPTSVWGSATPIQPDTQGAAMFGLVMSGSGDATVLWARADGRLVANRYDPLTGVWGNAEPVQSGVQETSEAQLAMDAAGNALAVWVQQNGTAHDIVANRFDAVAGTWGIERPIECGASDARSPFVAMDPTGNAIAVWVQEGIVANRFY